MGLIWFRLELLCPWMYFFSTVSSPNHKGYVHICCQIINRGIHTLLCTTTKSHQGLASDMNAGMDHGLFQSKLVEPILVTWHKDTSPDKQITIAEVVHYTEADLTICTEASTSSFLLINLCEPSGCACTACAEAGGDGFQSSLVKQKIWLL